jgi:hypothetical protein
VIEYPAYPNLLGTKGYVVVVVVWKFILNLLNTLGQVLVQERQAIFGG